MLAKFCVNSENTNRTAKCNIGNRKIVSKNSNAGWKTISFNSTVGKTAARGIILYKKHVILCKWEEPSAGHNGGRGGGNMPSLRKYIHINATVRANLGITDQKQITCSSSRLYNNIVPIGTDCTQYHGELRFCVKNAQKISEIKKIVATSTQEE